MSVNAVTGPRLQLVEKAVHNGPGASPRDSLMKRLAALSHEDQAELERYLRVYQRSGVGSLSGFIALC